jgi:hypothetical protein
MLGHTIYVPCSTCGAQPGFKCVTKANRETAFIHDARTSDEPARAKQLYIDKRRAAIKDLLQQYNISQTAKAGNQMTLKLYYNNNPEPETISNVVSFELNGSALEVVKADRSLSTRGGIRRLIVVQ